jgi:hypothetical protein
MADIVKTGYVQNYKLELHELVTGTTTQAYFSVTVSDDLGGTTNPATFVLQRNIVSKIVDCDTSGNPWAVSYGNVQQAIIATLKDALLNDKEVTVTGSELPPPEALAEMGLPPGFSRIKTVLLSR